MANKISIVFILIFIATSFLNSKAMAYEKEFNIFDLRKTLPLHDDDPVYKDYYVNIGTDNGVKVGSILAVYRHVPVIDIYHNKAEGDLVVPIGHVKVITAQKSMSVCRVAGIASEKQIPVVQYETVMMGDQVQLEHSDASENETASSVQADPQPATALKSSARAPSAVSLPNTPVKHRTKKVSKKIIPLAFKNHEVSPRS